MTSMQELFDRYDEMIRRVEELVDFHKEAKDDPHLAKFYLDSLNAEFLNVQKFHSILEEKGSEDLDPQEAKRILEKMWAERKDCMTKELAKLKALVGMIK